MELTKLTWGVRKIIDHVTSLAIAFSAFRHFIAAQGHDVRAKLGMFLPFVERHMPPAIPHLEEHYNKAHELDAVLLIMLLSSPAKCCTRMRKPYSS